MHGLVKEVYLVKHVVRTHLKRLSEALLMSTHNIVFFGEHEKIIPELSSNNGMDTLSGEVTLTKFYCLPV